MSMSGQEDRFWYKDAIIYEVHVRAFKDGDGDGIGDFAGLTEKLDYLRDLGITAIWLLPFYPSPLRDDGYDIADYRSVNPSYGTMRDFRIFMREAERRGLRVITELVINHTSDQHEWFQRARRSPAGSVNRNYYVWSDTADLYSEARVIFQDFEASNWTWDPVAQSHFWHRFYSHQPDLNFDNPRVLREVTSVLDYWMKMGVAGMRLDAIPYLFERPGTNCENLPETHQLLKKLRAHVDKHYPGRLLLSEANQWPEDSVAYFGEGEGDESHMAFHFPLMPRLFMSLQMEDSSPVIDILEQTPPIPETAQWAIFLRNHDELTLEMVTDEERDYMYRMYALDRHMRVNLGIRRRLASLLNNDRRKIELMNGLLFSLPGTPVMYYGDEIGMGDNFYLGDRDSVRTPMQWSSDRNAGFSTANPQSLYLPVVVDPEYHYEAVNVEAQLRNPDSLLWWTRRLIALRKRYRAFGRGSMEFVRTSNHKVLAYLRRCDDETVLVVANLSRYPQHVSIDLPGLAGAIPVELFGSGQFPEIGESGYSLSLAPYGFYWFTIEPAKRPAPVQSEVIAGTLRSVSAEAQGWESLFSEGLPPGMQSALTAFMRGKRWFGGKARSLRSIELSHAVPLRVEGGTVHALFLQANYMEGEPETYFLPVALAQKDRSPRLMDESPESIICSIHFARGNGETSGLVYDALAQPEFASAMLAAMRWNRSAQNPRGAVVTASRTGAFGRITASLSPEDRPRLFNVEQSNTSVIFGDKLVMKFFRRVSTGINPDYEIGRFLTDSGQFLNIAQIGGALEFQASRRAEKSTVAVLEAFVPNHGDAWTYTLDALRLYRDRVDALDHSALPEPPRGTVSELAMRETPPEAMEMIGPYLESARLLGQRTAEMHVALGSGTSQEFRPEQFTRLYQRSFYQAVRNGIRASMRLLRNREHALPPQTAALAREVIAGESRLLDRVGKLVGRTISSSRIRTHGDFHLGQVLYTGPDFVIIDFEGEPARPVTERRIKRSPLRDVASMLRSFHYAATVAMFEGIDPEQSPELWKSRERAADLWHRWVSAAYLAGYRNTPGVTKLTPEDQGDFDLLLEALLIHKAIYEVEYELNMRPAWVRVPLTGLLALKDAE